MSWWGPPSKVSVKLGDALAQKSLHFRKAREIEVGEHAKLICGEFIKQALQSAEKTGALIYTTTISSIFNELSLSKASEEEELKIVLLLTEEFKDQNVEFIHLQHIEGVYKDIIITLTWKLD